MTSEEVNRLAESEPGASAVLIGGKDDREAYYPAIVAFDDVTGRFVYDYYLLCQCFADEFRKSDESGGDAHTEEDYEAMGIEWGE